MSCRVVRESPLRFGHRMSRSTGTDGRLWVEWLAMAGATARGFVYFVIGCTAIRAAIYAGSRARDIPGAFKTIVTAPIGRVLLVLVAAGLAAFAVTCAIDSAFQFSKKSRKREHMLKGISGGVVAIIYAGLTLLAVRLLIDPAKPTGGRSAQWAAILFELPLGRWVVGAIGTIIIAVALQQAIRRNRTEKRGRWTRYVAWYAYGSRALILVMLGAFAIGAAVSGSATQVRGVSGAFRFLQRQMFGSILLACLGTGIALYGVFWALEVCRRRGAVQDPMT